MVVCGPAFLALLLLCNLVDATWFPRMEMSEAQWDTALQKYDLPSSYQTCTHLPVSGGHGHQFIRLYHDRPVAIVITGKGVGMMDVKFKDSLYVFDQPIELTTENPCLIIPPYQPLDWVMVDFSDKSLSVCSYEGTVSGNEDGQSKAQCDCTSVLDTTPPPKCKAVKFPRTIRKPEHEFFLTADITPQADDVTICTILTVDRLLRLSQMSQFWGGPISAAVYLHELSEIPLVMQWWLEHNSMRRHVDIHLVHDDKIVAFQLPDRPFPVNILRNVAIRFARTANVFYIEGDFIPSPDLYPSLGPVKEILANSKKEAFIVAPFSTDNNEFDMNLFPMDKKQLRNMINQPNAMIRDLSYFNSHSAFDFGKWFDATSIYTTRFVTGYEPYYIGPKSYPLFEEIFIGCGADKVSHPHELYTAGFKFNVLSTGFIVHIDSTGMGSAWCRGWAGNARSSLKWEAFSVKTAYIYSGNAEGKSFDSRIPWWDLAPVTSQITATGENNATPKDCPQCPVCPDDKGQCSVCPEKECPACPEKICSQGGVCPACECGNQLECKRFTEGYESEISHLKASLKLLEEARTKLQTESLKTETQVKELQAENSRLLEHTKFVSNISIGGLVVIVVVFGLWAFIWPKGKKVWALPTWKPAHHNL